MEATTKMKRRCGRPRGHAGSHAIRELGEDEGARGLACMEVVDEVQTKTDVVCVAFGELHRVDDEGRVACDPTARATWRGKRGEVVAALAKARAHALCRECFPMERSERGGRPERAATSPKGQAPKGQAPKQEAGGWIEIGTVAVRTDSILVASRVASKVTRTRQRGMIDGVEYMCLTRFRAGER